MLDVAQMLISARTDCLYVWCLLVYEGLAVLAVCFVLRSPNSVFLPAGTPVWVLYSVPLHLRIGLGSLILICLSI